MIGVGLGAAERRRLEEELAALSAMVRRSTVRVACARAGGQGSGVVWRADGLILTNAHVAREQKMEVRLWDGERLAGRVVRRDPRRDLAAIAVEARDLPAAIAGDPRRLRAGDLLVALGSPWGVDGALSVGVLHAIEEPARPGLPEIVRADVRLAPGNSGGPLADVRGQVVGLNTMIAGGLGIAVSVRTVAEFLRDLAAARGDVRAA